MATFTYTLPVVGGNENAWGDILNQNWTNIGTFIGSLDSTELAVLDGITATTAELNTLDGITATVTELNYTDGVTSNIQTQLNSKAPTAGNIGQDFSVNNLYVGAGTASYIYMNDSDNGQRIIHNNSNQIGFLTQVGGWGAYCDDSGNWTAVGNVTAYSDERLKSDIVTIPDALAKVCELRGVNYTKDGKASTGVIAQEVQKVIPEVVQQNAEYLSVAYGNLVGVLIEALKELKAEVDLLKKG